MNVGFKILFISLIALTAQALPINPCLPDVQEPLARANHLLEINQSLLATQQYNLVLTLSCRDLDKASATLGLARAYYRLSENRLGEEAIQSLDRYPNSEIQMQGRILRAWYQPDFRQTLPANEKAKFEHFYQAETDYRNTHLAKKPWLAGTLSTILPGSGQVYNGNYQSAAMSLILNSIFLATALEFQREGLHSAALAAGLVFSITYTGNIFGSIQSARQINSQNQDAGVEKMRQEMLPDVNP
jgi:hypothetical protein